MANTRDIKRRIKSVKNTKKITGAMELVAASKMKRAIDGAVLSRPYTKTLKDLSLVISNSVAAENMYAEETNHHGNNHQSSFEQSVLIVVVASNRGLCGAYNTQIGRELGRFTRSVCQGKKCSYVTIGKKADIIVKRMGGTLSASFHDLPETVTVRSLQPIVRYIENAFKTGEFSAVRILYTEFKTALLQEVYVHQLLPVQFNDNSTHVATGQTVEQITYVIEPNPERVMQALTSRYMTSLLYQYVQESRASEHSARMMAMRNAKDAADEMVEGLSLEYNKARQAGITREIAEISAGQLAGQR